MIFSEELKKVLVLLAARDNKAEGGNAIDEVVLFTSFYEDVGLHYQIRNVVFRNNVHSL